MDEKKEKLVEIYQDLEKQLKEYKEQGNFRMASQINSQQIAIEVTLDTLGIEIEGINKEIE